MWHIMQISKHLHYQFFKYEIKQNSIYHLIQNILRTTSLDFVGDFLGVGHALGQRPFIARSKL